MSHANRQAWARTYYGVLGIGLAILVLLAGGCAPPFGPRLKAMVIQDIGRILNREAYAAGVDFADWPRHVAEHQTSLDDAATEDDFADALGVALDEFDVSHIAMLSPGQAKRRFAGEFVSIGAAIGEFPQRTVGVQHLS